MLPVSYWFAVVVDDNLAENNKRERDNLFESIRISIIFSFIPLSNDKDIQGKQWMLRMSSEWKRKIPFSQVTNFYHEDNLAISEPPINWHIVRGVDWICFQVAMQLAATGLDKVSNFMYIIFRRIALYNHIH